ncbi:hypothetical protein L249_8705 [Ophiocordyceps polyrhachis-furcata BCC 54312]|uniref:Uncharacterized protein n=1 Tax=Ophiocordyceps polyrhachis-furcata BCC 54312 TaxID=1330021 RepID=A0A367L740_9HYPO|nr:hypothetical protein L249_8705 [Ophiocordyceps polyrhachis-furcata BCC 54312]
MSLYQATNENKLPMLYYAIHITIDRDSRFGRSLNSAQPETRVSIRHTTPHGEKNNSRCSRYSRSPSLVHGFSPSLK